MSEQTAAGNRINVLLTAKAEHLDNFTNKDLPGLSEVFKDCHDMILVGGDDVYCARFSIPENAFEEIQQLATERGVILEPDYTLSNRMGAAISCAASMRKFAHARERRTSSLKRPLNKFEP